MILKFSCKFRPPECNKILNIRINKQVNKKRIIWRNRNGCKFIKEPIESNIRKLYEVSCRQGCRWFLFQAYIWSSLHVRYHSTNGISHRTYEYCTEFWHIIEQTAEKLLRNSSPHADFKQANRQQFTIPLRYIGSQHPRHVNDLQTATTGCHYLCSIVLLSLSLMESYRAWALLTKCVNYLF